MKFSPRLSSRKGASSSTFDIQAEQDRISSTKDDINTPTGNKSSSPSSKKFPLKNLRKGKKDTNSAATAEKPMSISVNGKPLLEIHPTASVEDVQSFLKNVQTGIEAKTDAQEVTDDDDEFSVECSLIDDDEEEEEEEEEAAAAEKVKGKKKKSSKKLSLRKLQSAAKSMTSKSMKKVQKKSVKASKKDATVTATTGEEEEAAITNIGMVDSNAHKDVDVLDNDDDDETESIEAVEHEGFVHIGFLTPMEEEEDDATANDGSCNGYTPYHLQLMIDGVVVQTLAIHKQAMELLSNCITDAKQSTENNDIVEEKKEGEEIKEEEQLVDTEKVTQEEQPEDASEDKEEDEETDEQPAQQSFIHPMILEKLDDFIENAKKGFEEALAPATKEEVAPIESDLPQEEEKEEEGDIVPQEDNRNDSDEEVDPVDANEDKAEEEAGRDVGHPIDEGRLEEM